MGYILVVGVCLVPRQGPRWLPWLILSGGLGYGSLLGLTRIIQGGHFLSDVLGSGALMCFTAATLHVVIRPQPPESTLAGRDAPSSLPPQPQRG